MENSIWDALPPVVREEVDELIRSGRQLQAVKLIREAHPGPLPRLPDAVEVMCDRAAELRC
ncbi:MULTISPECIES: hypothetical protein [Streptomyces]|uniref:Uncharacterized protein n=1 Tax=Streptomyces spororaveus TaxID=284039 RepID=A0ABQ3T642_9ACTN|nr:MULTISPECIES: hypothetical protein [Streptomyces]MCM9076570.1 hypothetical protein [Streptomyces spororaveus]MCX5308772.1 hypothetical protein [Streptomyces sp. NBC_00160]GHI75632.1 hypothetical protein Sspor_11930 [Streptomyces spororaveus]